MALYLFGIRAYAGDSPYIPIVLWHGLGDEYNSVPMQRVIDIIQETLPEVYTHSVWLDKDGGKDQKKSFFGNASEEVEFVCQQLANITELQNGFNAIGFSQGGLFLRAYVERCNNPPIKTLVTFGSPHNGIADLPPCRSNDLLCKARNDLLKTQIWTNYAQSNVISAQYYRDPEELDQYLKYSAFLAAINNEVIESQNHSYATRLATLERLVLVLFSEDVTVVPKESAWFQEVNRTTGEVTPLEKRTLYLDDWIGLKKLGDNDMIEYLIINGVHMQISDQELRNILQTYMSAQQPEMKLVHQFD